MIQGVEPRSGTKMIKGSVSVVASPLESSRYWLHSLMDMCLFYALTPGSRGNNTDIVEDECGLICVTT